MDGTLLDSTAGVVGAWEIFRQSYPHIDVKSILSCEIFILDHLCRNLDFFSTASHGVRTIDNLRTYLGIEDPEILEVLIQPARLYSCIYSHFFRTRRNASKKLLYLALRKVDDQASLFCLE